MTDDGFDDQTPEPDFDDPAHEELRDLLASARVQTPIPAEVAARLDATLAELTGRAPAIDDPAPTVVPLRRRSRVAPRLLAAAAVIVVAGASAVGLGHVIQNTGNSPSSASADRATAAQDSGGGLAQPEAQPPAPGVGSDSGALRDLTDARAGLSFSAGSVPVLTSTDFADQAPNLYAGRLLRTTTPLGGVPVPQKVGNPTPTSNNPNGYYSDEVREAGAEAQKGHPPLIDLDLFVRAAATEATRCAGPKLARTASYPIVLDGKPAVLVVHAVSGGTRVLQAWSCDGSNVLAATSIPG